MLESPPLIPHDLQLRGNCLACHAGPGGVEEIRSTHPERANCRQCHLPSAPETPLFTRPLDGGAADLEQVP
jgi:cytochrome c-type protein NapB